MSKVLRVCSLVEKPEEAAALSKPLSSRKPGLIGFVHCAASHNVMPCELLWVRVQPTLAFLAPRSATAAKRGKRKASAGQEDKACQGRCCADLC